jgi:hypothetical protein
MTSSIGRAPARIRGSVVPATRAPAAETVVSGPVVDAPMAKHAMQGALRERAPRDASSSAHVGLAALQAKPTAPLALPSAAEVASLDDDARAALFARMARAPSLPEGFDACFRRVPTPTYGTLLSAAELADTVRIVARHKGVAPNLKAHLSRVAAQLVDHEVELTGALSLDDARHMLEVRHVLGEHYLPSPFLEAVLAPLTLDETLREAVVAIERGDGRMASALRTTLAAHPFVDICADARFSRLLEGGVFTEPITAALVASQARSEANTAGHALRQVLLQVLLDRTTPPAVAASIGAHFASTDASNAEAALEALVDASARASGDAVAITCMRALPRGLGHVVAKALRPDAPSEERADVAALLGARDDDEVFHAEAARLATNGTLARVGLSRLQIDAAVAHATPTDDVTRAERAADGRQALRDASFQASTLAVHRLLAAPEHVRRAFAERPAPTQAEAATPFDQLTASLAQLPGFASVLPAAHAAKVHDDGILSRATPDAALTRARPELWVPLLLTGDVFRGAHFEVFVRDALTYAAEAAQAIVAKALPGARTSSIAQQREGTVRATALGGALLEAHLRRASFEEDELPPLEPLLEAAGNARFAKDGPTRTAFLRALFRTGVVVERLSPHADDEWFDLLRKLEAPEDLKLLTRQLEAFADATVRAHPTPLELAAAFRPLVEGKRGGDGFLRLVGGIQATFHSGVEREAVARITAALEAGTLSASRRASLVRSRFPDLVVDDARLEALFDRFDAGAVRDAADLDASFQGCTVIDSCDVLDWMRAVDDIESCQSSRGAPMYNRGMLNRFEDGSVRLLAVRDADGNTLARGALRLVSVDGAPALLVDRPYPTTRRHGHGDEVELLAAFARSRSHALGIPLVLGGDFRSTAPAARHTFARPPPLSVDYIDSGGGIVVAGGAPPPMSVRLALEPA